MDERKKNLHQLLSITKTVRKMTDNLIKRRAMKLNRCKSAPYHVNKDRPTKSNTNKGSNVDRLVHHDNNRSTGRKRDISSVDEATENSPKRFKKALMRYFKSQFKLVLKSPKRRIMVSEYNTVKYYTPTLPTIPEESIL